MMCGSFGFELNPSEMTEEEQQAIPGLLDDWRKINPLVITGSFYRLATPDDSNWPAVQFVSKDGNRAVVFAFQQEATIRPTPPPLRLQGLDAKAKYWNDLDNATYTGATYMNGGLNVKFPAGDHRSKIVWLNKEQ
jgi:alpha-galactosidase